MALPPNLRNRLAELIREASREPAARRTLEAIVVFCRSVDGRVGREAASRLDGLGWFARLGHEGVELLGPHRAHRAALSRRAEAALGCLRDGATESDAETLPGLLTLAARLAAAGLFFEVHELLEPAWRCANGTLRVCLQALIQIAVGLHHLDAGNRDGAASLLQAGLAKLQASRAAVPLDTGEWEHELAETLTSLRAGAPRPPAPLWPHPRGGCSRETAWHSS